MDVKCVKSLLNCFVEVMQENKEFLTEQDSIVGDGNPGLTMSNGLRTAAEAIRKSDKTDVGRPLCMAGKAMSVIIPSTMGTLMASGFMRAGKTLKGVCELDLNHIAQFFQACKAGVMHRGKADINKKTFLGGIDSAVRSVRGSLRNHENLEGFAQKTYETTYAGYENTVTVLAVHGRAATRGEMSRSLKDPGACAAMLMMKALVKFVKQQWWLTISEHRQPDSIRHTCMISA